MARELFITFRKTDDFDCTDFYFKTVIRNAILATLENRSFPYPAEVSVTLCDNSHIKELNKNFRGVDRHTDVLSFPMYEDGCFPKEECESGALLGDIVISLERAREQAAEIGNTFLQEIAFLTVHSTLHLLGYDHERSKEEEEEQCRLQKEIVSTLEI